MFVKFQDGSGDDQQLHATVLATGQCPGHLAEIQIGRGVNVVKQILAAHLDIAYVVAANWYHPGITWGNHVLSGGGPRRLQKHVHVGSAESECTDTGHMRTRQHLGQGGRGLGDPPAPRLQVEAIAALADVRLRRYDTGAQHQGGLDQPDNPCRGHGMPHIGFRATQIPRQIPAVRQARAQRLDLHGITNRGGRTVRLHVVNLPGLQATIREREFDRGTLSRCLRFHGSRPGTVVVASDPTQPGMHLTSRGQGVLSGQHDDAGTLTEHKAIGSRVEGRAHTGLRDGTDLGEHHQRVGHQVQVHPGDDGHLALPRS
ncbi:Uncharacterised protein [Mycobacteroides abscessus subsp. abscessus]|nr:Uncharacterised protein [Mycobacteroides abscessus subsp. abscessus]